jgi:glutamyl-tRNA synthetase
MDRVLEKTGLRDVKVYEFARLNFIHTILSKRNLQWFVDNKIVEGWNGIFKAFV